MSRRNDVYQSGPNTALPQFADDIPREDIDMQRVILLNLDGEHHDRLRRIISRGFTARRRTPARRTRPAGTDHRQDRQRGGARRLCRAGRLRVAPTKAIAGLLGVPQEDRAKLFRWTNEMTGNDDPEFAGIDAKASSMEVLVYAMQMAAIKAESPGEDIVTALIKRGRGR